MQEQSKSVYKTLALLLGLVVIGLFALHLWYSGTLKANLAAQQAKIAEGIQQLKGARTDLDLAAQTEKGLRGDIERLQTEHRGEVQGLTSRIEEATQANTALKAELEAIKKQDAEALAAAQQQAAESLTALQQQDAELLATEKRKAADAYAELQGRFDTAVQTVTAMGAEILGLKQAKVDAAAAHEAKLAAAEQQHQAKLQEVEAQLNERIATLRTAFEGGEPERAALFTDLDERIQRSMVTIGDLETTKADLSNQLAAAKQTIEQGSQSLAETTGQLEATRGELNQTRGELAQLQTQHDAAMDKAITDQAALQAKHEAAMQETAAERAALAQEHAAAMDQAAKQRADLEGSHAAALDQAAKARADLEAQHAAALDQKARERAELEASHAAALDQAAKQLADLEARDAAILDQTKREDAAILDQTKKEDAAALEQTKRDAAAVQAKLEADLAAAKATHADEIGQANGRIETLTASLAAETAALAALQTKHDNLVAELNAKLADTEQTLAGVRNDLSAANQAAAEQKAALEQQIAEAKGRIAKLEETLDSERKQAEAARTAAQQAHGEAMAFQRGLFARFSEIGANETEQGMLLRIAETEMQFPVSKATLPKGELPSLDRIAKLMADYPKLSARIEGHTDASGRDETNLALSQARADAVKQALVDRGVAAERLAAAGIGEARPIADNATKVGARQNRRVEVYIIEAGK